MKHSYGVCPFVKYLEPHRMVKQEERFIKHFGSYKGKTVCMVSLFLVVFSNVCAYFDVTFYL